MELLSGFGKRGIELNLLTKPADTIDTEFLSKFFVLQEFSPQFTAGKNCVTFNGSEFLKKGSEVLVECVDSAGEPLYIESTSKTNISYKESSAYILSIHVYKETSNGPAKLILYGTLANGFTVKWIGNVMIDKTKQNYSSVRFYNKPTLEVNSILSPILRNVDEFSKIVEFTSSFYSYAVSPPKDSSILNKRNVNLDYRVFDKNSSSDKDQSGSFNFQLENLEMDFRVKSIQEPYSYRNINVDFTSSLEVKKVINNSTIILDNVITYKDSKNNDIVVNIIDGEFYIKYPYILYNTASKSSSYQRETKLDGEVFVVQQSYADIVYRNLKTFSGFIDRHKLYRRSLFSPGDFEIIADEPLTSYELLKDRLTINKNFDNIGWFYNQQHINSYWFTSSKYLGLEQSSDKFINGMNIKTYHTSFDQLTNFSEYIILKNNTSYIDRNHEYYPYNQLEFTNTSGSSYDCNFIELKKDVNYVISLNAYLYKDDSTLRETDAELGIYFTSSITNINLESNTVENQRGLLKLGSISFYEINKEKVYNPTQILFSVSNDLYGTVLLIPYKCIATISEFSIKPYGDYGFSPDTLITRIPFPVTVKNEAFEIKSELFDINSNLVYSNLRTVTTFDPSGSSLILYIPGLKDPSKTVFISGSLVVSESLQIGKDLIVTGSTMMKGNLLISGTVFIDSLDESSYTSERMLTWNPDDKSVRYTNVNNILPYSFAYHNGINYIDQSYNAINPQEVRFTLYDTGSSNKRDFIVIPCIPGRNVYSTMNTNVLSAITSIN